MLLRRYHLKPEEAKPEVKPEPVVEVEEAGEVTESFDLEEFTVAELKDMARDEGIEGYSTMRKAELIEALRGE